MSDPLGFWLKDCSSLLGDANNADLPKIDEFLHKLMDFILSSQPEEKIDNSNPLQQLFSKITWFYKTHPENFNFQLADLAGNFKNKESLKKLTLLVLGCAIRSDKAKLFVDRITEFPESIQLALADHIRQITDMKDSENDSTDETETTSSSNSDLKEKFSVSRSNSPTSELKFLAQQMSSLTHENRQLRTQAENRDEECRKLEVELAEKSKKVNSLENERLRLLEKEKKVKELSDDLQAARCRIERLQPLENVEKKFREAKDGQELYKSKYESVTEKNNQLEDTILEMEKKMKTLQIEHQSKNCQTDILSTMRDTVRELEAEIGKKNEEIEEMMDEKYRLDLELKEREERILQLELNSTTVTPRHVDSLADQLEDAKKDEYEIMKAEIRKLRAQTEGAVSSAEIIQLDDLRQKLHQECAKTENLENELEVLKIEREEAITGLFEARRKFSEFQNSELEKLIFELDEAKEEKNQALKKAESLKKRLLEKDDVIEGLHDVENSLKILEQQLKIESRKVQNLREDLVSEKSKKADLIGKLRSLISNFSSMDDIDDEHLITNIDDIMMNAIMTVRRESDSLRLQRNQQIAELADLKRDIEKLRRSESESLSESDDKVRELTRENIQTKEQVFQLQEKIRELKLELSVGKKSIEELNRHQNAEITRLEVSVRNSQTENSALREELQTIQKQNLKKSGNLDELEAMHKTLLMDHSRLQQLHSILTKDYDEVKMKVQTIPRQQSAIFNSNLRELEAKLAEEISRREMKTKMLIELEKEHKMCRLLKSDLSSEISKLTTKLDAMSQLNRTYNEENKNLSRQLEILLNQNKELLKRALHDKDQYHLEMKDFQDQLSALRRHKEKLEDKIMDQYRSMESKKTTPERKQPLVKRAAKALINRRRVGSNGGSTTEDSSVYSADELADDLPPTCSSSEDPEEFSSSAPAPRPFLRSRNDFVGGSVRMSTSPHLPPRIPLRNTPMTSSLRSNSRPPPPPYTPKKFEPIAHSTPIREADRPVVAEGETRETVMDKEERLDKTLSFYENVGSTEKIGNESTIWYEYGCV